MKSIGSILALGLALGFGATACGGDDAKPDAPVVQHDAAIDSPIMIDAPMPPMTLTTYVIDLVKNHTDNGPSRAFTEFSTLPDPDQTNNNLTAYSTLFP